MHTIDHPDDRFLSSKRAAYHRTPEEAAARKALQARQDIAGGIAYNGAMASGLGVQAAKRAAAKARRETT